jgi:hypothetical protein
MKAAMFEEAKVAILSGKLKAAKKSRDAHGGFNLSVFKAGMSVL